MSLTQSALLIALQPGQTRRKRRSLPCFRRWGTRPTDALPHPAHWTTTTVGTSVLIRRGVSWSKEQEHPNPRAGRVPVIRIGNVQDRLRLDDLVYLSGLSAGVLQARSASAGWTLIVGSNGNRQ